MHLAIGIDLGATNIKGVLMDEEGQILANLERETLESKVENFNTGEVWKKAIYEMVQCLKEKSKHKVAAIGLAAPGIPDKGNNSIEYMPGRLEGLEHFNWHRFLDEKKTRVAVLNDAHAALMAEAQFGTGRGIDNILMLTLGTGVGGGVMINGKLYQGYFQRAGHLGHMTLDTAGSSDITGMPGSLEYAIGNASINERTLGRFQNTQELLDASKAGDFFATYIWLVSIKQLAVGISSLINAFAPEMVILGGGITQAGDELFKPLEQFLDIYEWRPGNLKTPLKKATFGKFAGAMGAATFSLEKK